MRIEKGTLKELQISIAWTALLTLLFLFVNRSTEILPATLLALPFFIVLYFLLFSTGKEKTSESIRMWLDSNIKKIVIFPAILIVLYFSYVLIVGKNPFKGAVSMVPFLVFFPALVFAAKRKNVKEFDWLDFATFVLFLLPITLISSNPSGKLPEGGKSFDSVYRIVMMLTGVYAFVVVRGLDGVGFFPEFKIKSLATAIGVWMAYYIFVYSIGYSVNFIVFKGHDTVSVDLVYKIALTLITTFLHTALFEELFFRGIFQNMLSKRISQSRSWLAFWKWGLAILFVSALLVGYTLKGSMQWFPALITLLLFLTAFFIEKSGKFQTGVYTSLAITGVLFGLVHYHSGSIIYIGFACVAGWAYGYTWIKTRNVFYAALVHALVNTSALMFGLELMR